MAADIVSTGTRQHVTETEDMVVKVGTVAAMATETKIEQWHIIIYVSVWLLGVEYTIFVTLL